MASFASFSKLRRYWKQHDEELRFIRDNLHWLLIWPILALIIGILGWSLLITALDENRHEAEFNALKEAQILAAAYANHLFRTIEAVDHISLYVKHGWEESNGRFILEDIELTKSFPTNSGLFVSIINKNGHLITSNIPEAPEVNVSGQPYFTVHKNATDLFYIGTARIGNFSGQPIVPFSRRLNDANGRFYGIVLVSVAPENFISGYDEATLKANGLLAILGMDNSVLLARVGNQILLPDARTLLAIPTFESSSGGTVLDGEEWFSDMRTRYIGWHATQGYDMITLAGIDQQEALEPYLNGRANAIKNAMLLSIGLAIFTVLMAFFSMRLAWKKIQIEKMRKSYRAATEAADEGFYILSPVCGEDKTITDFRFVDCNAHGAEFLRYRRDELLGKTVLAVFEGKAATDTMRMLRKAMKEGFYESEADWRSLGIMQGPEWVHIKIARQENDLSVTMRDVTAVKSHLEELEKRSNQDALTGLPNRHWVNAYLPQILARTTSNQSMVALLFIDLDGFKSVNDTLGHDAGDEVLRAAGRRLKDAVRPHDDVVRLGGDEFLVILENLHSDNEAAHVTERILDAFQPPFKITQGVHAVSTSIGIALFPQHGKDAQTLLKNADLAMYSVKAAGKRGYRFFTQKYYEAVHARHQQEIELKHALAHDQLVMYYQPRVDVSTGITSSMEALVRWAHPTKGIIEPNEFIPLAQETGLINTLGEKVLDKVCAQLAFWKKQNQELVPVSINIDARQFHETNIVAQVASCLNRYDVDPALLEVELTESTMLEHTEEVIQALSALQKMGIKLLVDDFGTGYSSLSQLHHLDFDVLKVDQSFTARLNHSKEGKVLFNAIVTMAHSLDMKVVAEGVETLDQINTLKELQCDEIQGFYISRPLPASMNQPIMPRWIFPASA